MQGNKEAFPLHWPLGFPRTKHPKASAFKCTTAQARDGIIHQVALMQGKDVIISTNVPVTRAGTLYSNQRPIDADHGVAVYFTRNDQQLVLACDTYLSVKENLRAIEHSLHSIRALERYGCSDILNRTFAGMKALPAADRQQHWSEIFGLTENASRSEITRRYKELAKKCHPDINNGDKDQFHKLSDAYAQALKQVGEAAAV